MKLKIKLTTKGLLLVMVPLVFEVFLLATLLWISNNSEQAAERAAKARKITTETNTILSSLNDSASQVMTLHVHHDPKYSAKCSELLKAIPFRLRNLKLLTRDDPNQQRMIDDVEPDIKEVVAFISRMQKKVENREVLGVIADLNTWGAEIRGPYARTMDKLHAIVDYQTRTLKDDPETEAILRQRLKDVLIYGVVGNIVLALWLTLFVMRNLSLRVQHLMDNTVRLSKGAALAPVQGGTDEIAQLDIFFHRMADQLAEADRKKREVESLKQQFIAMVSHDLKSPLTTILGSVALLNKGVIGTLTARGQQIFEQTEIEISRLLRLISDLLDIARMEAGRLELHKKQVSLQDIIFASLNTVKHSADAKNIVLESQETDAQINVDADRIIQVVTNLLFNAIKFSPDGAKVSVTLKTSEETTEVGITDEGPGVPDDMKELIFEQFKQIGTADDKRKGSGLGLAICKMIVEAHDGKIGVTNAPNKGSTFWFKVSTASN